MRVPENRPASIPLLNYLFSTIDKKLSYVKEDVFRAAFNKAYNKADDFKPRHELLMIKQEMRAFLINTQLEKNHKRKNGYCKRQPVKKWMIAKLPY